MSTSRRVVLMMFLGLGAVPVLGFIALFAWTAYCHEESRGQWGSRAFSVAEWKAADRYTRYVYVNDLIESKKLDGLTRDQVRAMLGVPDHENDEGLRYLVRPIGCYVDDWALDIDFERDTVKDYAIRPT